MLGFKKVDRKPFQIFILKLESMTDRTRLTWYYRKIQTKWTSQWQVMHKAHITSSNPSRYQKIDGAGSIERLK